VKSSSGVSHFISEKDISMKVVNSNDALIALPDIIYIRVEAIQKITKYFNKNAAVNEKNEDVENEKNEDVENKKINENKVNEEIEKNASIEPIKIEEVTVLKNVYNNLTIKNNMSDFIKLSGITFNSDVIKVDNYQMFLGSGDDQAINLTIETNSDHTLNTDNIGASSSAVLYFNWNNGCAIIYKDVVIDLVIEEEIIEEYLEKEK
jgi:hypothetical protein